MPELDLRLVDSSLLTPTWGDILDDMADELCLWATDVELELEDDDAVA